VSSVLAATPGVMMWDDHDIFDGFGSYSSEFQQCSIIRGLFSAASNAFMKFQLCIEEPHELVCGGPKLPDFSHAIRLGKAVFIALDFRSSRSADLLWTDLNWKAFERHLIESKTLFTGAAHCFAVVPVPPIFLNFPDLAVKLLHALPGHAEPEDDCRDQWTHFKRRKEQELLFKTLVSFAVQHHVRVTILSGDSHTGSCGILDARQTKTEKSNRVASVDPACVNLMLIHQLTSSAVVSPCPKLKNSIFFHNFTTHQGKTTSGMQYSLLQMPGIPKAGSRSPLFLWHRNFLSLCPTGMCASYIARWYGEDVGEDACKKEIMGPSNEILAHEESRPDVEARGLPAKMAKCLYHACSCSVQ